MEKFLLGSHSALGDEQDNCDQSEETTTDVEQLSAYAAGRREGGTRLVNDFASNFTRFSNFRLGTSLYFSHCSCINISSKFVIIYSKCAKLWLISIGVSGRNCELNIRHGIIAVRSCSLNDLIITVINALPEEVRHISPFNFTAHSFVFIR